MTAPLSLPRMEIAIDSVPLPETLGGHLLELRVQQKLSLPSLCELLFLLTVNEADMLRLGAHLHVKVESASEELFSGYITAVDYLYDSTRGREVRLRAYDKLHALRQRQTVRTLQQMTLLTLARELTADLGLLAVTEADGPVWQRLIQTGSDLDLLAEVAERSGLYFVLRGLNLHILSLAGIGEPYLLQLGTNLLEARIEVNVNGACNSVTATGWDPWHAQPHGATARLARSARKFSVRLDLPDAKERKLVALALQDDAQAAALAQAALDVRTGHLMTFWGVAEGNASLRPGSLVGLDGVGHQVAGNYVLTAVTHTIDPQRGFQSELSSVPPPPLPKQVSAGCALGQVTRVDDPEHLGRVQVSLPAFCNVETDWLEVVAPGAGAGKGLLALPDVGDTVLLLLAANDPSQAVVIGSLFAGNCLPKGEERVGQGASFSFVSPGGHKLRLDDGQRTVRIEDSQGSFLELAPALMKLHAACTIEIEAPGQQIRIRGQNIDFERT